jgi:hypothetical protein
MTQRQFIVGTTPFPVQVHDDSERETQLFTGSLSGTHSASISATAAQTLASVTQAATLTVTVAATASQTLATVTQSATLAATVAASATQTLDTVSQSSTGAVVVAADAAQTLGTVTQSATIETGANGASATQTLDDLTQTATVETAPAGPVMQPASGGGGGGDVRIARHGPHDDARQKKRRRDIDKIDDLIRQVTEPQVIQVTTAPTEAPAVAAPAPLPLAVVLPDMRQLDAMAGRAVALNARVAELQAAAIAAAAEQDEEDVLLMILETV